MYYIHGVVIVSGTPRDKERSYYIIIFFYYYQFRNKVSYLLDILQSGSYDVLKQK